MVRFRQLLDRVAHRMLFVPLGFVVVATVLSQITLAVDRRLTDDSLPRVLETTVGSGRSILSAMASGLISSVALLLSLMLVAVQLAGSRFSPRSVRDWIGDRTQRRAIGMVLGTTVYCLLVLRETRDFGDGEALTPHLSVLLALLLGLLSLVAVVRSVDHLTDTLRIGRVADNISSETVELIKRDDELAAMETPTMTPAFSAASGEPGPLPPANAFAVVARSAGWVQQIDEDEIIQAIPEGSTALLTVVLGSFTLPNAPILWVWPEPEGEAVASRIQAAVALGDTRTMQEDVGFGILQLVDIALRALSPGINDPNTANDVIVHLGVIVLAIWERPLPPAERTHEGRTLISHNLTHSEYAHAAFDQIRRYGSADGEVAATLIRTLDSLRAETIRRDLPGPVAPLSEIIEQVLDAVSASNLPESDQQMIGALVTG